MSKEQLDNMRSGLDVGHAALLVIVNEEEVTDTAAELTQLGGRHTY